MRLVHYWIVAAVLLSAGMSLAAEPAAKAPAALPKITISKETTYITEPLRPDGYPDYVAALNKRMSEGITPENNACVLLLEALGPKELFEPHAERVYRALEMKPLPAEGNYLVSQSEIIKRWKVEHPAATDEEVSALDEQFSQAQRRPWSAEELPLVDKWLEANEKPLQLAVEASRRPKYFWPLITDEGLVSVRLPVAHESRELARLLVARAMLQAHAGKIDEAWDGLLACHRLGRLVGQGSTLIDALVCHAIDAMTLTADCALAHHAKMSAKQVQKIRADLQALPLMPDLVEKIGTGERYMYLDATLMGARGGPAAIRNLSIGPGDAREIEHRNGNRNAWAGAVDDESIVDWDVPLRMGNQWYDRIDAIGKISDSRERKKHLAEFDNDIKKLVALWRSPRIFFRDFFMSRSITEFTIPRIGGVLVALFMPALNAVFMAQQRAALGIEMGQTALALAAYRADNSHYPNNLDQLVSKYLAKVPEDTFAKETAPIRYRRDGDAYVLWTVHMNGIDDNGRSYEDEPPGDDYVLRPVPAKKSQ